MLCHDGDQPKDSSHSLAPNTPSTSVAICNFRQMNISFDTSVMASKESVISKQENQNASAPSKEEGIVRLLERTQYVIAQENGQRRYGPPPEWKEETPQRGCEIFIGKIPRDCFEDELIPIFERIGPIYMFRLMMEYNGANRGYGFCVYTNKEDTKRAVDELNNYEIRKGKTIGVCFSVDNCRLFVGGIPKNKTKEEILTEMKKVTDGVKDVISYPSVNDKTKNRGFAFVEYDSHRAAAMARRKLIPGRIQMWNQQIAVDWAEPEREVNEDIMSKVKILYVRNLMLDTTEEELREKFSEVANGDQQTIERVKKISDYAFIHFKERDVAKKCIEKLNGTEIDGSTIEVTWAKPADKNDALRPQSCRSSKQLMDWSFNGDVTSQANMLLDPTSALFANGAPLGSLFLPPAGSNSQLVLQNNSSTKTGRRNAAGGRSAAAQRERKHPIEALEDFCRRMGYESPEYAALPINMIDYQTGKKMPLFIGRVTIPCLQAQYHTPNFYRTIEEAKAGAAEMAIYCLYPNQIQIQMIASESSSLATESEEQIDDEFLLGPKYAACNPDKMARPTQSTPVLQITNKPHSKKNVYRIAATSETAVDNKANDYSEKHQSRPAFEPHPNGKRIIKENNHEDTMAYLQGDEYIIPGLSDEQPDQSWSNQVPLYYNGSALSPPNVMCLPEMTSFTKGTMHITYAPSQQFYSGTTGEELIQIGVPVFSMDTISTELAPKIMIHDPSQNFLPHISPMNGQTHNINNSMANVNCAPGLQPSMGSILPVVLPPSVSTTNPIFPPISTTLPGPSGLYPSHANTSTFQSLVSMPATENTLSLGPLQNLQLRNQLFDYSPHVFPNRLTGNNILSYGNIFPQGTVIMDPSNINTQTNTVNNALGSQPCQSPNPCIGSGINQSANGISTDFISQLSCQNGTTTFAYGQTRPTNYVSLAPILPPVSTTASASSLSHRMAVSAPSAGQNSISMLSMPQPNMQGLTNLAVVPTSTALMN